MKSWSVVYKWQGRMKRFTIGTYPAVSLADARGRAFDALCATWPAATITGRKDYCARSGTFAELAEQYMQEWSKINKKVLARGSARVQCLSFAEVEPR